MDPVQRISQESKVTSTPLSSKAGSMDVDDDVAVPTPSISNISKPTTSIISSSHNESSQSVCFDDSLLADDAESVRDDNDSNLLQNVKLNKTGAFWRTFKPKHADTLYHAILTEPINSGVLAEGLAEKFEDDPEFYVKAIIKLLVDICGYQNLDIKNLYNVKSCDPQALIEHMQNDAESFDSFLTSKTNAFFLLDDSPGKTSIVIKSAIYNFFRTLILKSHDQNVLFNNFIFMNIFETLRFMASSNLRHIRKTGIMVALKMMTGCIQVHHQVERKKLESESSDFEELNDQQIKIKQYMHYLYTCIVHSKNCLIPDKQCYDIRRECANEIAIWAKYAPEYTLSETKCITILLKLIQDEHPKVRMAVLNTLQKLLSSEEFQNYLSRNIESISEVLAKRIFDVDLKIAVKSCDLFLPILKFHKKHFQAAIFLRLLKLIYNENYELSRSASKIVITCFRMEKDSSEEILLKLAKLNNTPVYVKHCRLLVESVVEFAPELKLWDLFVALLKKETEDKICNSLSELLYESISFHLLDRPLLRTVPAHAESLSSNKDTLHEFLAHEYIPHVNVLLNKFDKNAQSLTLILKIVSLINPDKCRENYNTHYVEIIKKVIDVLLSSENIDSEMLYEECIKVLSLLFDKMNDHKNQYNVFIDNLITKLVEELNDRKNNWLKSKTDENKTKFVIVISIISKLFKHFDLTSHLSWEDVFVSNQEAIEILAHYQSSSMSHLIWRLKNALVNQTDLSLITDLTQAYDDYLKRAFRILDTKECDVLTYETFASICGLLYTFHKHLKHDKITKLSPALKSLLTSLPNEDIVTLTSFLEDNIILAQELPLEKKILYTSKIFDLLNLNVLPFTGFASIFRFYDSHYQEFRLLFEDIISKIEKYQGGLILTIMHTLATRYQKISITNNHVDINSKAFKSLCNLAKKFSSLKLSISEDVLQFIDRGLVFSLKLKKNYNFLHLLKYFVEGLEPNKKTILLNKLRSLVTGDNKRDDVVLFFSQILKRGLKME